MLDTARQILGTQPILTIFLAIGVGYLVGQIRIGSFSLGVSAVLLGSPLARSHRRRKSSGRSVLPG